MNTVILIGNLGKDPELRYVAGSGKAVCNFSIAVERPFSKEKISDWFNIIVWNKPAENAAQYLHKGSKVAVKSYLTTRNYEGTDGVKRYVTEIVADTVKFIGSKPAAQEDEFEGFQSIEDDSDTPF